MDRIIKAADGSFKDYDDDALIYITDNEFHYNPKVDKNIIKDITEQTIQIYTAYFDYDNNYPSSKIYLVGRGKYSGKVTLKIMNYFAYCYIKNSNGEYESYKGEKLEKLVFKGQNPDEVFKFRRTIEFNKIDMQPLEADIQLDKRFLIDCSDYFKPKEEISLKIAVIDIETNHPVNDNIISYAVNDLNTGELVFNSHHLTKSSKELVLDLLDVLKEYDVIFNWNVRNFDFDILTKNLKQLDLDIDCNATHYCATLDAMQTSEKMYAKQMKGGWSLDNVGMQLCGIGKIEKNNKHPRDLDFDTLMEYNVIDTILVEVIDNVLGGLSCHLSLMKMLGCKLHHTESTEMINDMSTLKAYHKDGKVLSSKMPHWQVTKIKKWMDENNIKYRYKAAEPSAIKGTYYNVGGLDVSAAYPSAVLAINASVETLDPNGKYRSPYAEVNGESMIIRFNDGDSTFINELKRLMDERYKIKSQLQNLDKSQPEYKRLKYIDFALKTQVAAYSHGIFGYLRSRMNVPEVAAAICATARSIVDLIKLESEKLGYTGIYRHTDSCFLAGIKNKEQAKELVDILNKKIEEFANINGWNYVPKLDYEGFYPRAYIHSPARKVLVKENGEWETTGCNFIRAEVAVPLAEIEKKCIDMKLDNKTIDEIIKEVRIMVKGLKNFQSNELGIEKPLKKSIEKYGKKLQDGTYGGYPYHITALVSAMEEYGLDINVGDRFKILPVISQSVEGVRVLKWKREYIAFPVDGELPKQYQIDYEEYLKSNLYGKINDLFDMTPDELEQVILTDDVRKELGIRLAPVKSEEEKKL